MRLVLNGNTQNLHALIVAADARYPHINVDRLQIWFPPAASEAGNAGANCKIGGPGLTTTLVDADDQIFEDDRYFRSTQGSSINGISLKSKYVRGSANNTIIIVEAVPA